MRPTSMILACLLAFGTAASAQTDRLPAPAERPPGSPGTPTPQPFVQPQPRNVPSTAPHNPPLLDDGTGYRRPGRDNLAPPDRELPLLQQQLRRNIQDSQPGRPARGTPID